ncbi:hypothetical protein E6C76_17865 [Pseudothauera nasutitermitis]|uniref:Oligosaccharide repeat unit polymerase n=1 Tax=Pseudothauera nasutitermitis TaxID=2565930 RepID=A0A4S4AUC0_9RHOO|nr:hypothetical protein [Pseudothauera nasutitermitis]THF63116.1 hypothetical protein E6C76_17865 [Pseudothauera nasutitermitis]
MQIILFNNKPLRLFVGSYLALLTLLLIAPIESKNDFSALSILIGVSFPLTFALFYLIGQRRTPSSFDININPNRLSITIHTLMFIVLIGVALRLIDRIALRGASFTSNFMDNRLAVTEVETSAVSFFALLFCHFSLIIPTLLAIRKAGGQRKSSDKLVLLICFLYPMTDLLLFGLRYPIIIQLVSIWITSGLFYKRGKFLKRNFLLFALAPVIVWTLGYTFTLRASQSGIDPIDSMTQSAYAAFTPISPKGEDFVRKDQTGFIYGLVHIAQYFSHGVFEFFYAIEHHGGTTSDGAYSFYIPFKIVVTLFDINPSADERVQEAMPRAYVYTTYFGPLFFDFGHYALFASCVIGFYSGRISKYLFRGRLELLPLYIALCTALPFAAAVNILAVINGQIYLLVALLTYPALKWIKHPSKPPASRDT